MATIMQSVYTTEACGPPSSGHEFPASRGGLANPDESLPLLGTDHGRVLQWDHSEWCSGTASTSRFCGVGILHGRTNIPQSYFSFITLAGMYLSLKHLSSSDAATLTFVTPILTGFSAAIFLKAPLSLRETFSECRHSRLFLLWSLLTKC
jgi:hypothetical protein